MSEKIPSGKSVIPSNSLPDRKSKGTVSSVDLSTGNSYFARETGDDEFGAFYLLLWCCGA
jgi:hypothetical protein